MTTKEYREYYLACAVNHKQLLHTEADRHFHALQYEEILNGLKTKLAGRVLFLENHEGVYDDQYSDNVRDRIRGGFMVLEPVNARGDFDKQNEALDNCQQICIDIVSKMWNDAKKAPINFMRGFTPGSVSYQMVGPLWDNHFGYRVTFEINAAAKIGFDESKWNDESIHT